MEVYTGNWVYNDIEEEFTGQLEHSDNGEWSLLTELPINKKINLDIGDEDKEFIRGTLLDNRNVSIINGIIKNISTNIHNDNKAYKIIEYDCEIVIIGPYFEKEEDVTFKKVRISYSYLKEWLNKNYFIIEEDNKNLKEIFIKLEAKRPKSINIENDNNKIDIIYEAKANLKRSEINIKYEPYIEFTFNKELKYEEMLNKISEFARILTILIGRKTYINKMIRIENHSKADIYDSNLEKNTEELKRNRVVIRYHDIEDNMSEIILNWNKKINKLKNIINNLVDLLDKPYTSEYLFIMVSQALEAFSKEMRNNKEFFRKKLIEVLKETDFLINIVSDDIINNFAYRICKTRNYLVHLDDSETNKDRFNKKDMFYVGKYLTFALQALVLKELGLKEELIKERISMVNKGIIDYVRKLII